MDGNLDLRDELAGYLGWSSRPYARTMTLWYKGDPARPDDETLTHPVANTLDAASAAIREAGYTWERLTGRWWAYPDENNSLEVLDTDDETRDLLKLAVAVWKNRKEQQNGK